MDRMTAETGRRGWLTSHCSTERDRQNERRFAWSALAWGVALVGSSLLVERDIVTGAGRWVLAVAVAAAAAAAILAYVRFLRGADELTRRIQTQGMAAGFGAAVIVMMGWPALELVGAPRLDVSDAMAIVMLAWAVGVVAGQRRYG